MMTKKKYTKKEAIELERAGKKAILSGIPLALIGIGAVSAGYVAGYVPLVMSIGSGIVWVDLKKIRKHFPKLSPKEQVTFKRLLKEGKQALARKLKRMV